MYLPEKVPFDAGDKDDVSMSNHENDVKTRASPTIKDR
jgi:hypothetical protein